MNENNILIDEKMYKVAVVLKSIKELQDKGFLKGGHKIDKIGINSIVTLGKKLNLPEPTKDEMRIILSDLQKDILEHQK